ncbi:MAG: hypothetical protein HGGPFJEG_00558 [Ignavibacteria bacterium]|nr:hypothetical protein [Ignavibacteria bacterium]
MKRRNLIKGLGALGVATVLPVIASFDLMKKTKTVLPTHYKGSPVCWLTPQLTEGPYYFNANLNRSDVRYNTSNNFFHDGIRLNMNITVIDYDCNPVPGVIVDIWHTNIDGVYSGYNQPGGNYTGHNFMRGFQTTNQDGVASFITSYPGWYPGRATHVHFKVRLSSSTIITSQYCFLDSVNNAVYATPLYSGRGPNPTTNAMDSIFHNADPPYLRMTAEPNTSGGYDGTYIIGINDPLGISSPGSVPEGYSLSQNYPNPFNPKTKISYTIPESADVKLTVSDILGKEVVVLENSYKSAGTYELEFDGSSLGSGYYIYKLKAGDVELSKEMLLLK